MMMEEEGLKVNKLYSDDDDLMKIDYLPPGFRFHPTDEEIITHYLKQKVLNSNFSAAAIGEADLNKSEPWDLPKKAKMGQGEKECYLFCQKDRKYPTGMRTNRATESGYWKATGKDKEIYTKGRTSSSSSNSVSASLIGMKKTLVFYRGRAPKGEKTNWIMHEYRLVDGYYHLPPNTPKDEWVVSRVFQKSTGGIKKMVIIGDGDGDDDLLLDCPNYSISNTRPHPPASIDDYCEDQFKGSNLNVTASNNKYIISNTGVHQSSRLHQLIDQNTYLHPPSNNYYNYPTTSTNLVPLQNHPSYPFQSPPIIPAYNITNFKVEQLSSSNQTMAVSLASQDTGLSTDMNTTADISSNHETIRGRSNRSYEIEAAAPSSMPDYGCIWDDY